ncbi:MAG TPA: histidine kinase dimerization/phospho-acceptor domain-containing protein [Candidatus Angelobacter sp.]|nr:histidine kinase dimerization/phospho-acceptor domain-containing protein [Candidatus Angelobacter sp.]
MSVIQKFLHNPIALKMALLAVVCFSVFLLGIIFIRRIRRTIQLEAEPVRVSHGNAGFALATYDGLARQLREQEKELQRLRQQYQTESATAGTINEAVLTNLNSGVLFLDRMGIVRQANRAAKSLLGYSSPFSFHMRDLFRGVTRIKWPDTGDEAQSATPLIQALQETLRNASAFPRMKVDYRTPSGQKRVLAVTASAVQIKGEVLGISCLLDDLTEITELSQEVHRSENLASLGEISAGMVHDFKRSLATVRGYAQTLLKERSDPATRLYAEKIIAELDSLSRIADEFLEFASSTKN